MQAGDAIRRLDALVGQWEFAASVGGHVMARGRASFEWIEGGAFVLRST
jgi:hypothetical protein